MHTEAHISLAQVSEMLFLILTIVNMQEHQTEKQLCCNYRLPWEELFGFREFMKTSTCRYPLAPHPTPLPAYTTLPSTTLPHPLDPNLDVNNLTMNDLILLNQETLAMQQDVLDFKRKNLRNLGDL